MTEPLIDPLYRDAVAAAGSAWTMGPDDIERRRSTPQPSADDVLRAGTRAPLRHRDEVFGGVSVALFEPAASPGLERPLLFFVHGGGMIMGNRFSGLERLLAWLPLEDYVLASPEYRLAPEHPDPVPADDCWAAFIGLLAEAPRLGVDADRVLVAGSSAGGGLAAGLVQRARDAGGPAISAQMLLSPMLDDRDATVSGGQFEEGVPWTRGTNRTAWNALLGSPRREPVSPYAAPARAASLAGLPTSYIDTGSADLFRDEDVAYASRLWADGVQAELHIWPGAVHGFDSLLPDHPLSAAARAARAAWLTRVLATPAQGHGRHRQEPPSD